MTARLTLGRQSTRTMYKQIQGTTTTNQSELDAFRTTLRQWRSTRVLPSGRHVRSALLASLERHLFDLISASRHPDRHSRVYTIKCSAAVVCIVRGEKPEMSRFLVQPT